MRRTRSWKVVLLAMGVAGSLITEPAVADKPAWAGGGPKQEASDRGAKGKGKGHERDTRAPEKYDERFVDRQRVVIREYYVAEHRGGRCPPGLAKKNNGCMRPGQAKKWRSSR